MVVHHAQQDQSAVEVDRNPDSAEPKSRRIGEYGIFWVSATVSTVVTSAFINGENAFASWATFLTRSARSGSGRHR